MASNSSEKREQRLAEEAKSAFDADVYKTHTQGHNETQKSQTKISFNAMDFVNESTDKQRARESQQNDKKKAIVTDVRRRPERENIRAT